MENKKRPKTISLEDHNKKMIQKHENNLAKELEFIRQRTNIKCEKCHGFYRHINYYMTYVSTPPQKAVECENCKDQRYIFF